MINYPKQSNQETKIQITWDDLSSELFENLDYQQQLQEKQKQSDINRLWEVFSHLFGTENLWNYCYYTKSNKQCSDWSDLYSIIKYQWKDLIIKVWAWEFNTDVFNTWWIKELKWFYNTSIPLFVVNQSDGYFANREQQELRTNNPKEYLNKYAIIIIPKWSKAYFRWYQDRKNSIDFGHINIRDYQNTINQGRLAILHKEFPNWQFQDCLKIIEQFQKMDFHKFYSNTRKHRQHLSPQMERVLWCFRRMWIYRTWSWVWDIQAYQSLYDTIQLFDLQQQSF